MNYRTTGAMCGLERFEHVSGGWFAALFIGMFAVGRQCRIRIDLIQSYTDSVLVFSTCRQAITRLVKQATVKYSFGTVTIDGRDLSLGF